MLQATLQLTPLLQKLLDPTILKIIHMQYLAPYKVCAPHIQSLFYESPYKVMVMPLESSIYEPQNQYILCFDAISKFKIKCSNFSFSSLVT